MDTKIKPGKTPRNKGSVHIVPERSSARIAAQTNKNISSGSGEKNTIPQAAQTAEHQQTDSTLTTDSTSQTGERASQTEVCVQTDNSSRNQTETGTTVQTIMAEQTCQRAYQRFRGEMDAANAKPFVNRAKQQIRRQSEDPQVQVELFSERLEGDAAHWCDKLPAARKLDLNTLAEAFEERYGSSRRGPLHPIYHRIQGPYETIGEYTSALERGFNEANVAEQDAVNIFVRGLRKEILLSMGDIGSITTLHDALRRARGAEEIHTHIQQQERTTETRTVSFAEPQRSRSPRPRSPSPYRGHSNHSQMNMPNMIDMCSQKGMCPSMMMMLPMMQMMQTQFQQMTGQLQYSTPYNQQQQRGQSQQHRGRGQQRPNRGGRNNVSNNNNRRIACPVCGLNNHSKDDCKHKNATCRKCHRTGHLDRMCRD